MFDENGSFTYSNSLDLGQQTNVRGKLLEDLSILSSAVEIGDLSDPHDTALTEVVDDKFNMEVDSGEAIADEEIIFEIGNQNQTLIRIDCRTEAYRDAIKPSARFRAIGKLSE